eukprot:gene12147-12285_t
MAQHELVTAKRIQELDHELSVLHKLHRDQAQQLEHKDTEIYSLRTQLNTWRTVKEAEAASLSNSNKQLTEQLTREMARSKALDNQLTRTQHELSDVKLQADNLQQQLVSAEQRAAAASSYSQRTTKDLQQQLSAAEQDAADRIKLLQQQLVLEKDRLQAERESHTTTQQQLRDVRQQLTSAVARVGEAEAAAAAGEGRALRAEMQATTMAGSDTQSTLGIDYPSPAALSALQGKQQQLEQHKHNIEQELLALKTDIAETRDALKRAETARAVAAAQLQTTQQLLQQSDLAARLAATELDGLKKLSQLAGGDYDPSTTRVLHLAANPAAEVERLRQQVRLDRLETENKELREALTRRGQEAAEPSASDPMDHDAAAHQAVSQPVATGSSDNPAVAAAVAAAEIKVLTRKLELAEKQAATMKDVFKQRVRAFRESCRFLFGYKVDMVSDPWPDVLHAPTTYTLTSCLGNKQDVLMFRYHPTAEPQYRLVKTALSQRLAQDVQVFIDNFNCIPAFTANHTMTLFQQTTNT